MQCTCPRCHRQLEFSGDPPVFCAYCAAPLGSTQAYDPETTLPPRSEPSTGLAEPVPEVVGGYRLVRALGGGGMGTVYEAEEASSGRRVALKLIAPEFAGSAATVERFRQEGRLASSIAHPRCVFVLAADEQAGRPYIVMELMPGTTLYDLVGKEGPLPPEKAITAILDVIDGLEEAHRHGVIHRDVKPSNCFLDADGRVKVGDFGLSKSLVNTAHLTRTGSFLGTPLYASPEQIKGEAVDPQTDVYSTAATLYFLLTGRAPFEGGDPAATLARIVSDPAPSLRTLHPDLDAQLDQVVLRGLERDRGRRWRDLAEFRAALAEFLPGRLSVGGLGIRFGAFAVDWFLLIVVKQVAGVILLALLGVDYITRAQNSAEGWALQLSGVPPFFLYFALLEGIWGASLGKLLLRLRVRRIREGGAPGLGRALVRAVAFTILFDLNNLLVLVCVALWFPADLQNPQQLPLRYGLLLGGLMLGGFVVGVGLLLLPMRRGNGYRGLHEFLSGTRVVRLPAPVRRPALRGDPIARPLLRANGCPARLGAFAVRGVLGGEGDRQVLLGQDPVLGREVWIWLRPATEPALSDTRHGISRTTRLRWLASGADGGRQWDAFIAPAGSPLPEVVAQHGPFAWADVRPLLEALTDELRLANAEGTVPDPLGPEQVWLQPDGSVRLLDMAWGKEVDRDEEDRPIAEQRAVALLGQVAVLALEGAPRPVGKAGRVRAPLPGHAARILRPLLDGAPAAAAFRKVQAALGSTAEQPAEVTRPRRAAHLALLAALLFVGGGCCLFPAGWGVEMMGTFAQPVIIGEEERALTNHEEGAWRDFAASSVGAGPTAPWPALGLLHHDLTLRDRLRDRVEDDRRGWDARVGEMSQLERQQVSIMETSMKQQREQIDKDPRMQSVALNQRLNHRPIAEWTLSHPPDVPDEASMALGMGVLLVTWPAIWVVWAFLWRGGLSYRIVGIDIVRGDGRPAPRYRCAWRAFLVWAPPTALLLGSLWLQARFWQGWHAGEPARWLRTLSDGAWYAALLLLAGYVVLALLRPGRAPHDRLAGTYLVPK
jgi:hypothetical protein